MSLVVSKRLITPTPVYQAGPMGRMRDKSAQRHSRRHLKGAGSGQRGGHITKSNAIARQASVCFTICSQQASRQAGCDDFHTRINQSNGSSRNGKGMGQSMGDGIWNSAAGLP